MNNNIRSNKKKSGIYKVTNIKNKKVYIGQSVNLKSRLYDHKYQLINGIHHNSHLQKAFNKYGEKYFVIEILEECERKELNEKEQFWISFFESTNRKYGYNFESGGSTKKVIHEETKEKIRATLKVVRLGEGNPMYGTKLSDERKKQISIANSGSSDKLTEVDVREIKIALYLGVTQKELSELFEVRVDTINKIGKGHSWGWVLPQFNNSQSIAIEEAKKKREKVVTELFDQGMISTEIVKITPYTINEIRAVLKYKSLERMKKIQENIKKDYHEGMSRKDIATKYECTLSWVNKILKDKPSLEFEERNKEIKRLHELGVMNKVIAEQLGIHRTTVTEVLKGRIKEKKRERINYTKELEAQILSLLSDGVSQRKTAEKLDISRDAIKKAIKNQKLKSAN